MPVLPIVVAAALALGIVLIALGLFSMFIGFIFIRRIVDIEV